MSDEPPRDFETVRAELLAKDAAISHKTATGAATVAARASPSSDAKATALAEAAFAEILARDTACDPERPLTAILAAVEKSELFRVMRAMPMGALLHTHGIATGPWESLVRILQQDPRVHIYVGPEDAAEASTLEVRAPGHPAPSGPEALANGATGAGPGDVLYGEIRYLTNAEARAWRHWKKVGEVDAAMVLALMRLDPATPKADLWPEFQHCWNRVRELSDCIPLWHGRGSYWWAMMESLLASGVTYVEVKTLLPDGWVQPSADGESVDRALDTPFFMRGFVATVEDFRREHPRFLGARVVWCGLKHMDAAGVRAHVDEVLALMEQFPGYVAGYDLVGHEDVLDPIRKYQEPLAHFKRQGGRLLLHAGETLDPAATQLYDAVAIGSERIGHAFALPKSPTLMAAVKEKGIVVECCPISNQSLGYCDDLRLHPGLLMVNNGLNVTISSDDAAMFGYDDVSLDFCVVAKAWGLTLAQIKHIARNSFKCSAMEPNEVKIAEAQFDVSWNEFIHAALLGQ